MLPAFLAANPNVRVELIVDDNLTDIVANRFDAGIRFGNIIEKDMIAVRVGPDMRRAVVGSPAYFARNPPPRTPRDLGTHDCISYRLIKTGGLYAWEFEEDGHPIDVRVTGSLVFNDTDLMRASAIAGMGVAYLYDDDAADDIEAGRLIRVLEKWCPLLPGYYLYHPSRRQSPAAVTALIAALRASRQPG